VKLNKPCELEDFRDGDAVALIRAIEPELAELYPDYPAGKEHRKSWEYQQIIRGAVQLNALNTSSHVLCFPAGHERTLYEMSTRARYVFACDVYGAEGQTSYDPFLIDPGSFAQQPWAPARLIPRHMDSQFLRFDAGSIDFVVCPGFSRFSPAPESAGNLLLEFERVLRPGGIGVLCLEFVVNGAPAGNAGPEIYNAAAVREVLSTARSLELVEELQEAVSASTLETAMPLDFARDEAERGRSQFPHIVLQSGDRLFTTSTVFFRKIV
jgi:hypothetical protein